MTQLDPSLLLNGLKFATVTHVSKPLSAPSPVTTQDTGAVLNLAMLSRQLKSGPASNNVEEASINDLVSNAPRKPTLKNSDRGPGSDGITG